MPTQLEQLKRYKKLIAERGGKKIKKKRVVMKRPRSIRFLERDYLRDLLPLIAYAKQLVTAELVPVIERSVARVKTLKNRSDSAATRLDDWVDDVENTMAEIRLRFGRRFNKDFLQDIAGRHARKINGENKRAFSAAIEKEYKIPPISLDAWQAEAMKAFVKENVDLITSIPSTSFEQIEKIVMRDVQAGTLTSDIADKIQERFNVSESRAALIARDQTNKFNGNLTELRQTSLGITKYVWSTIIDGRERPEHRANNGKEFEWKNPPATGHPGEDINCRCTALAVFDE